MINWLHNFIPSAIIISIGPISLYWYGLFLVLGMISALFISLKLSSFYKITKDQIFDFSFWLIINGLIGARLYDVLLEFSYYSNNFLDIFKVWEGGLAIHGGIIAGLITLIYFSRRHHLSFWSLAATFAPGLALGQAIGRFGNYFNQELFGRPTNFPWGIPIEFINRPVGYQNFNFFHPTFLYESLGLLIIFFSLWFLSFYLFKRQSNLKISAIFISTLYVLLYSCLRFSLEFIKIDPTPIFLNLRWPQFFSLILMAISLFLLIFNIHAFQKNISKEKKR